MAKGIESLLEQRLSKKDPKAKVTALAQRANEGHLSSFSGVFSVSELSQEEKKQLEEILLAFGREGSALKQDLESLIRITAEVKAINNQAALLHGERIKKAHAILTRYKEGAFTAWLIEAYGNRQTPYNFMQYFEFHSLVPKTLHPQLELMPRQAIYTLASRNGALPEKIEILESYQGESKQEMLEKIRLRFPLQQTDRRQKNPFDRLLRVVKELERKMSKLKPEDKKRLSKIIKETLC